MDYMDWEPFYNCWSKEGLPALGGREGVLGTAGPFVPLLWESCPFHDSRGWTAWHSWGPSWVQEEQAAVPKRLLLKPRRFWGMLMASPDVVLPSSGYYPYAVGWVTAGDVFSSLDLLCLDQKETLLPFSLLTAIWPCSSLLPWLPFPKPLLFVVVSLAHSLCPSRSSVGMYLTHGPWWSPLQTNLHSTPARDGCNCRNRSFDFKSSSYLHQQACSTC